jgi:hypothetical protein
MDTTQDMAGLGANTGSGATPPGTDTGETDTGETDTGETDTGETDTGETDTSGAGETDTGETDTSGAGEAQDGAGGTGGSMDEVMPVDEGGDSAGGAGGAMTEEMPVDEGTGDPGMDTGEASLGPAPSAQCGSGGGMPNLNLQNTLMSIPDSYDGTTPVPVVIAFHAAGNGNDQMKGIIGSTFEKEYIMLYPKSAGNEWNNNTDAGKVDDIFAALDAGACYDKNRVFAAGHSSGAQFLVQRLCAGEDRWRAVSPVASSVYCNSWDPIPALVIHGIGDVERTNYGLNDGDGLKDIVPYRTSNGCQETYTEVEVEGCQSGGVQVDPGCRDFDGCSERTRWCQHNDPQYGTSHHGVPCFGARVMKDFFDMYR